MHIISRKKLRNFWSQYPRARRPLDAWYRTTRHAVWDSFDDVKALFRHADRYKRFVIFDIGGNKFRVIAAIHYNRRKVYIRHILTHAEYTRGDWKNE